MLGKHLTRLFHWVPLAKIESLTMVKLQGSQIASAWYFLHMARKWHWVGSGVCV